MPPHSQHSASQSFAQIHACLIIIMMVHGDGDDDDADDDDDDDDHDDDDGDSGYLSASRVA